MDPLARCNEAKGALHIGFGSRRNKTTLFKYLRIGFRVRRLTWNLYVEFQKRDPATVHVHQRYTYAVDLPLRVSTE